MLHYAREAPVSMLFSQPLSPSGTPGLVDLLSDTTVLPDTLSAIPTASSFWYVMTVFPVHKDTSSIGLSYCCHLDLLTSAKGSFKMRSHFEILGTKTLTHPFVNGFVGVNQVMPPPSRVSDA